jgi:hypothetical protein
VCCLRQGAFFIPYAVFRTDVTLNGLNSDIWSLGLTVFFCVVLTATLRLALEMRCAWPPLAGASSLMRVCGRRFWTWLTHVAIWGSLAFPFLWSIVYCNLLSVSTNMYGTALFLFRVPQFWLTVLLTPCLLLLPDVAVKLCARSRVVRSSVALTCGVQSMGRHTPAPGHRAARDPEAPCAPQQRQRALRRKGTPLFVLLLHRVI